ncbi:MAG: glycosyltransferase, partial [Oscillibacter sp.]|nr:glycosyltransferase [Oscillibacter sp.]
MAIYSGADLFLMPSKSEPCGLSQMIAMRYGTVPIVRETGGLKDTVQPHEAWRDAGTGFTFANYSSGDMLYVIREAVYLYKDYPDVFARLRERAMKCDFSWARSAREYLRIYATITGMEWPPASHLNASRAAEAPAGEAVETPAAETEVPVEMPAAEETPAVPFEEAPAAETLVESPVEEAPAAETPVESPVEEVPAAETPVEPPVEEAPAAETPVETPVEEVPAAEAAEEPAPEVEDAPKTAKKTTKKTAKTAKKTTKKGSKKGTAGK